MRWFGMVAAGWIGIAGCEFDTRLPQEPLYCGDGIVFDGEEECDLGNDNADNAACTSDCKLARCGDGLFQDGVEECDLGPDNADDDFCTTSCLLAKCGDSLVQAGVEECDNGPNNADDAECTSSCERALCGDGLVLKGQEECDNGEKNAPNSLWCTPECTVARCGDGWLRSRGEECDDGNIYGADGCGPLCQNPRVLRPDDADNVVLGESPNDRLGEQLDVLGDVNGDGSDDLGVVGSSSNSEDEAYIFYDALSINSASQASVRIRGTPGRTVRTVHRIGDVDGDGLSDVAILAKWPVDSDWYSIYIFLGPLSGSLSLDDAYAELRARIGGRLDATVVAVGDTNGDSRDDFIALTKDIATPLGGAGIAHVIRDVPEGISPLEDIATTSYITAAAGRGLGSAGTIGDADGDGMMDLFLRVFTDGDDSGQVYGFRGAAKGVQTPNSATFSLDADARLSSASSFGDLNRDGFNDLVVREIRDYTELSRLHVFYGPLLGNRTLSDSDFTMTGEFPGGSFISRVTSQFGDLNGDGFDDFAFTSNRDGFDSDSEGNIYVVMGPVEGPTQASRSDAIIRWGGEIGIFNILRTAIGDINGDGVSDLIVADTEESDARGALSVFLGNTLTR